METRRERAAATGIVAAALLVSSHLWTVPASRFPHPRGGRRDGPLSGFARDESGTASDEGNPLR
ncbi:hypothetical protein Misp03_25830 [Microbispora sp. NBRC 16548]|nr:hypothetical protein Misp03_25830 [Microbispora sp. NBRC 16548]